MDSDDAKMLALLELGRGGTRTDYRREALAWLDRRLGFDGVIWGEGHRDADGVVHIAGAELRGRPDALVEDYGRVAHLDPVARRFARDPRRLQNVSVARDLARAAAPVADYLRRHHVGQLLLCGVGGEAGRELRWLTLYRDDARRPFDERQAGLAAFAIPFVLLAEPRTAAPPDDLTAREYEVARAYADGADYKSIARRLAVSPATVRTHLQAAFRKLGVHNKIALRARLVG